MKKIITILFLLKCSAGFTQYIQPIYAVFDYRNGVKYSNLKNNGAEDSVLTTDTSGRIKLKISSGGSNSSLIQALTDEATITWSIGNGSNATVVLTGNRALNITNAASGGYGTIVIYQDFVGSRTITLPVNSKVINGGGGAITLTTASGGVDILTFFYDGTNFFWNYGKNYN